MQLLDLEAAVLAFHPVGIEQLLERAPVRADQVMLTSRAEGHGFRDDTPRRRAGLIGGRCRGVRLDSRRGAWLLSGPPVGRLQTALACPASGGPTCRFHDIAY